MKKQLELPLGDGMSRCAECGVTIPTEAAFMSHTDDFCSVKCLQLHAIKGAKDINWEDFK